MKNINIAETNYIKDIVKSLEEYSFRKTRSFNVCFNDIDEPEIVIGLNNGNLLSEKSLNIILSLMNKDGSNWELSNSDDISDGYEAYTSYCFINKSIEANVRAYHLKELLNEI